MLLFKPHFSSVEGTSDDLDVPIKRIFHDSPSYARDHNLCSVNSINWARVLVQAAHHIYAYFRALEGKELGQEVEVLIPTGACGNVTGTLFTWYTCTFFLNTAPNT